MRDFWAGIADLLDEGGSIAFACFAAIVALGFIISALTGQ